MDSVCYISVTMSTWSPSPIINTIITPIRDIYNSFGHPPNQSWATLRSCPLQAYYHPRVTLSSSLLWAHYHWHILCHCYSVIIGGYQLGLFTHRRISSTQTLNLHFRVRACTEWSLVFIICLFHVSEIPCSYISSTCLSYPVLNLDSALSTCPRT